MEIVKNRIDYLDIAKGIAIILVLLGHSSVKYIGEDALEVYPSFWWKVIYSFHMPLFFVAAGIISHPQKDYSIQSFLVLLKKNFYAILLPYFLFCLIYMPFSLSTLANIAYGTKQTISLSNPCCPQLWFLPCLFVAKMLMYRTLHFSTKVRNKQLFCCVVMIATFTVGFLLPKIEIGYPLGLNIAFVALGFMLWGYLMQKQLKKMDAKGILFQIFVIVLSLTTLYIGNAFGTEQNFLMKMFCADYGSVFWFFVNAFAGIIAVRGISSVIAKINLNSSLAWLRNSITWLGQNTICIFLLHMPMGVIYIDPWMVNTLNLQYNKLGDCLFMTFVVLIISIIGTLIINKVFPPLFGRKFDCYTEPKS